MMRDFPISLAYVKNPKVPSKSQLKLNRRKEIENETIKYQKLLYEGKHKDEIERLTERELGRINHLRQRNSDFLEKKGLKENRTKKLLEAERAAQTAMEISKKCEKLKSGIHVGKLPLYSSQSIPVLPVANESDARPKS